MSCQRVRFSTSRRSAAARLARVAVAGVLAATAIVPAFAYDVLSGETRTALIIGNATYRECDTPPNAFGANLHVILVYGLWRHVSEVG